LYTDNRIEHVETIIGPREALHPEQTAFTYTKMQADGHAKQGESISGRDFAMAPSWTEVQERCDVVPVGAATAEQQMSLADKAGGGEAGKAQAALLMQKAAVLASLMSQSRSTWFS
jgi:hypothetical protein